MVYAVPLCADRRSTSCCYALVLIIDDHVSDQPFGSLLATATKRNTYHEHDPSIEVEEAGMQQSNV